MKRISIFSLILILAAIFHLKNSYGLYMVIDEKYKANLEKGIDECTKKLKLNPNDAETHFAMGQAYYNLVKYFNIEDSAQKAESEFKKALELKPDYQSAYHYLGIVYMLEDKEGEAIAVWEEGDADWLKDLAEEIKRYRERIEQCKKAIAANPKNAEAYFVLGGIYFGIWERYWSKNKLNSAVKALRASVAINPNFAEAHASLGYAYGFSKNQKEMAREFRKAVEIEPNFPPFAKLYMHLGDIDVSVGRLNEAMNKYRQAFKLQRHRGIIYDEHFETSGYFELFEKEDERCKKAIENNPSDYEAHYMLAIAYSRRNNIKDAIAEFEEAIRIKPDYADAYCALGSLYEGIQPRLAIENYNRALQLSPEDAEIYYNLAKVYIYLSNGQSDKAEYINEAKEAFKKAMEINPNDADTHYGLGKIFEESGELDKAIEELKKAIVIEPYYAVAHQKLGEIYGRINQPELAKQHIKEAERLGAGVIYSF